MPFVLTESCIRCKYEDCVDMCLAPQWKTTTRIKAALPDAGEWTTVDAKRTELKR